jgi:hypothetical protein
MEWPEDQVIRRRRFEAAHPDIEIQVQRECFISTWTARKDGEVIATAYELAHLLHDLERRVTA